MAGQPHHRDPRFVKLGRAVRRAAEGNPEAVCWRCGRRLHEHDPRPSRKWSAGHTVDQVMGPAWLDVTRRPPAGVALIAPEVLGECNVAAGNRARESNGDTGYDWP